MQIFKQYLEPFIEPLFGSLTCGQQTTAAAAGEFIGQVRDLLGPNIWAGRLTEVQQQSQASSPHVPPPSGELLLHHPAILLQDRSNGMIDGNFCMCSAWKHLVAVCSARHAVKGLCVSQLCHVSCLLRSGAQYVSALNVGCLSVKTC